ncbi:MAG: hypothetical protein Q8P61_02425 [Candidatus Nanopelagicales bacterium]|nr:hypothetical protein [Candidatus Nanopelagicales bacterium]
MVSITIRDVPEDVRAELAGRAAATGRSLQEYLRLRLTEMAEHPDAELWAQRVRARKSATGSSLSTSRILRWRDAGRK